MLYISYFVQDYHFWWIVGIIDIVLGSGSWSFCCVELQGRTVLFWQLEITPLLSCSFLAANTSSCTSKDSFLDREEKNPQNYTVQAVCLSIFTLTVPHYWCGGVVYNCYKYIEIYICINLISFIFKYKYQIWHLKTRCGRFNAKDIEHHWLSRSVAFVNKNYD